MKFLWWLLALSLGLYGLALNGLNHWARSLTIHNHVDEVLRIVRAVKREKLGWL